MLNFYRLPQDYLKFTGNDRLDLINRLSTNQVVPLDEYSFVKTVLTSDKGRIIDLLTLYNLGEIVFASCSFDNAKTVLAHLYKYTIMDDFAPADLSGSYITILFFGNKAIECIAKITGINAIGLDENKFTVTGARDAIVSLNNSAFGGIELIYSANDRDYWESKIFSDEIVNEFGLNEFSDIQFDAKRIELGIPALGREMSELTNPLECGLNKYVSFTKGCYIGQEVIARLDAYDKISKHLVGLEIESDTLPDKNEQLRITTDGKECGFVTSIAHSDKYGSIAIGFIKTIFLDHNRTYKIKFREGMLDCSIAELPFTT